MFININVYIFRSVFNANGIKGEITMHQRNLFEPTWLNFTVHSAKNELRENTDFLRDLAGYQIRTLPPDPDKANTDEYCKTTAGIFNPSNVEENNLPPPGYGTQGIFNAVLDFF